MLISPAYAQDLGGFVASAGQFLPIVLIFVVFYFLLIRPQQQRQKETKAMLAALKRGDKVITGGGILGVVTKAKDNDVEVEIAEGVRINVLRDTISSVVNPKPANDSKTART